MEITKKIMTAMPAGSVLAGLSACEREGPGEKAGKALEGAATGPVEEAGAAKEAIEKNMVK